MVHLAGGLDEDGFYLDPHAHPVPEEVFGLLAELRRHAGPVPVILERDAGFTSFGALRAELDRARTVADGEAPASAPGPAARDEPAARRGAGEPGPPPERPGRPTPAARASLRERQRCLAELLTDAAPAPPAPSGFEERGLRRSRAVLQHKRVDDALPLLPRSASHGEPLRGVALAAVREAPRAPRGAGIADARRIAAAAAADPRLAASARLDGLELRSRFGRGNRPRRGPYLGREDLPDGRRIWAWKWPGREAPVRLFEGRTTSGGKER
jgi:uncharacterized protein